MVQLYLVTICLWHWPLAQSLNIYIVVNTTSVHVLCYIHIGTAFWCIIALNTYRLIRFFEYVVFFVCLLVCIINFMCFIIFLLHLICLIMINTCVYFVFGINFPFHRVITWNECLPKKSCISFWVRPFTEGNNSVYVNLWVSLTPVYVVKLSCDTI